MVQTHDKLKKKVVSGFQNVILNACVYGPSEDKDERKKVEMEHLDYFRARKNEVFEKWMNMNVSREEVNKEFKDVVSFGGHYISL